MKPRKPLRNVIFDFGGVLVTWRPQEIIDSFYEEPALREALRTHAFQHDDWLDMDRGTLDEAAVALRCAARMARPEAELKALFDHVRAALQPIDATVAFLRELRERADLKLYGLSNMSATIFAYLAGRHDFFELFDGIVVSAHIKLLKPEPEIYVHLRDRFDLDFAESVFIDDMARNVESARAVGLPSIQFLSTDQVRRELAALL
ncbi:MAG TPA: HAD family phosphatase [Gammaproteobacteria bacterium]|nr:HAD family phosphatase [Gammaproteobacteria bacterium]